MLTTSNKPSLEKYKEEKYKNMLYMLRHLQLYSGLHGACYFEVEGDGKPAVENEK